MKITRCKFTCVAITKQKGWNGHPFVYAAEFQAVTDETGRGRVFKDRESFDAAVAEDRKFFAATPGGNLKVYAVAADHFEVGCDYYLDLTPIAVGGAT